MKGVKINLGGPGESTSMSMVIEGCPCRSEDFVMALVRFSNQWKKEADKREPKAAVDPANPPKPCGCKGDK